MMQVVGTIVDDDATKYPDVFDCAHGVPNSIFAGFGFS